MVDTYRDLRSMVTELKGYAIRVLEPNNDALTSIQKQAMRDELAKEIKSAGISFSRMGSERPRIIFTWSPSVGVRGTGTITDVSALGAFPIRLSLGDQVSVYFEPRDLGKSDQLKRNKIDNTAFADVKKGSPYEFQGMTAGCSYYCGQASNGHFEFSVERGGRVGTNESALASFFRSLFGSRRRSAG